MRPALGLLEAKQKQEPAYRKDQEIETDEGLRIDFGTPLPPGVRVSSWRQYETVEFVDNFCGGTSRVR